MACRLIVNVDDFGLSSGVNEAVARLHQAGVVTSTSLMVAGPAAEDAVRIARSLPSLAVGLHMVLVHGPALLPRERIPLLVDGRGHFDYNPRRAGLRYSVGPLHRRQLQAELAAQFDAFEAAGLPWSHADSHLHFNLTPVMFEAALSLALRHRVPGFRVPEDDLALYRRLDPADARAQWLMGSVFHLLCRGQRPRVEAAGFVTPRWCYGLFRSGRLTADYLTALVERLPDGLLELHCHPDLGTPAGSAEYEALSSPSFREALSRRSVELTTYTAERHSGRA